MTDPLSKFIIVKHWHSDWEIYKTQYLNTVEEARKNVAFYQESDDLNEHEAYYKIFELKEVSI